MSSSKSLRFLSTFRHQVSNLRDFQVDKYSPSSLQNGVYKGFSNTVLIYFDANIAFISHLKLGKNVLEKKIDEGKNGTLVRISKYPDIENLNIRGEMEDYGQVEWNIHDILSSNTAGRKIVYMIRDPYQKVLSAVAQISISNIRNNNAAYNFLSDKFKSYNRFYYNIIEKIKVTNSYKDFNYNHKFFKRSMYYNALYSYFDFVIKRYSSVLFLDDHLSVSNIINIYHLLAKYNKKDNPEITVINLDSKKEENIEYINNLYKKYGLTDEDLLIRNSKRHSNFIYKPIVKDVLENLSREYYLPFYLYLNPEYYYFRKILTKLKWTLFNKKLLS